MPRNPPPDPGYHTNARAFEQFVADTLRHNKKPITQYEVLHDTRLQDATGAEYQIDIKASFRVLGLDFVVLCECKHTTRAVERDDVMAFAAKLTALGAHKGVVFSTGGFQRGAEEYARTHGIALVKVVREQFIYQTKSSALHQPVHQPIWVSYYGQLIDEATAPSNKHYDALTLGPQLILELSAESISAAVTNPS